MKIEFDDSLFAVGEKEVSIPSQFRSMKIANLIKEMSTMPTSLNPFSIQVNENIEKRRHASNGSIYGLNPFSIQVNENSETCCEEG